MSDRDRMAENHKEQVCEGNMYQIRAVPPGLAIQRQKTHTIEGIRQFENQTQQDKDWTYTEARNETATDDIKASNNKTTDQTQKITIQLINIQQ